MAEKCLSIGIGCYMLATSVLMMICSFYICRAGSQLQDYDLTPSDVLGDIAFDWETVPFVDAMVTTELTCPSGWEEVFTRVWYGMRQSCDCLNSGHSFNVDNTCSSEQILSGCNDVAAQPAIRQSQFSGLRVCGKHDGDPYLNVTLPLSSTSECPEGTSACTQAATVDQMICYPQEDHAEKCPITDIRVVQSSAETAYIDMGYAAVAYNSTASLVFSKSVPQLPPTTRKVEFEPCKQPSMQSSSPSQLYYEAEMNKVGCQIESETDLVFDPRYQVTGLFGDVYDVQSENGVLSILTSQLDYSRYVDPPTEARSWKMRSWSRPTVSWSLECEAAGDTRQKSHRGMRLKIQTLDVLHSFKTLGFTGVFIFSAISFLSFFIPLLGLQKMTMISYLPTRFFFLIGAPVIASNVYSCLKRNEQNRQVIQNMALVDQCTDAYTKIVTEPLSDLFHEQQSHLHTVLVCFWVPMAFVILDCFVSYLTVVLRPKLKENLSENGGDSNEFWDEFLDFIKLYSALSN